MMTTSIEHRSPHWTPLLKSLTKKTKGYSSGGSVTHLQLILAAMISAYMIDEMTQITKLTVS